MMKREEYDVALRWHTGIPGEAEENNEDFSHDNDFSTGKPSRPSSLLRVKHTVILLMRSLTC
jgi:hypothetical protein